MVITSKTSYAHNPERKSYYKFTRFKRKIITTKLLARSVLGKVGL